MYVLDKQEKVRIEKVRIEPKSYLSQPEGRDLVVAGKGSFFMGDIFRLQRQQDSQMISGEYWQLAQAWGWKSL